MIFLIFNSFLRFILSSCIYKYILKLDLLATGLRERKRREMEREYLNPLLKTKILHNLLNIYNYIFYKLEFFFI